RRQRRHRKPAWGDDQDRLAGRYVGDDPAGRGEARILPCEQAVERDASRKGSARGDRDERPQGETAGTARCAASQGFDPARGDGRDGWKERDRVAREKTAAEGEGERVWCDTGEERQRRLGCRGETRNEADDREHAHDGPSAAAEQLDEVQRGRAREGAVRAERIGE